MSIFKSVTKTSAEIAKEQVAAMSQQNDEGLSMLKSSVSSGFLLLWYNDKSTPQDILDQFGTNALELFKMHQSIRAFIRTLDPTYIGLVPPYNFTINQDGTVTVGSKITPDPNYTSGGEWS